MKCAFCGAVVEGGKEKEGAEPGIEALAKVCAFPVVEGKEALENGWGSTHAAVIG